MCSFGELEATLVVSFMQSFSTHGSLGFFSFLASRSQIQDLSVGVESILFLRMPGLRRASLRVFGGASLQPRGMRVAHLVLATAYPGTG